MPAINMIAPRRAEKRRMQSNMQRLVLVILVETGFLLMLGCWMGAKVHSLTSERRAVAAEIDKLEPVVKQIKTYDSACASLAPRLTLLNQAKSDTMRWYNTLELLTQTFPEDTWLTRLSTRTDTKSGDQTMTLSGMSATQANVGNAMMRLEANPDLDNVSLDYTQSADVAKRFAIEFEIDASMKNTDEQKGVAQNGVSQS